MESDKNLHLLSDAWNSAIPSVEFLRGLKLNAPIKDNAGVKKVQFVSFFHPLCFVTQRRKVVYVVDCRIDYSRISTFDLFALR